MAGIAAPNSCVAAGPEVAEAIAEIMGVKIEAKEPDIARPGCYFGVQDADFKYIYDGLDDCRAVALLGGGMKVCTIGCLGLGTCEKVCPFNAIDFTEFNWFGHKYDVAAVNEMLCKGCGSCSAACLSGAIQQKKFDDKQILSMLESFLAAEDEEVEI